MTDVNVGDCIKDNDPRMQNRLLQITDFIVGKDCRVRACASNGTSETRIRLDRIHTDGKPRKSGWSRVSTPWPESLTTHSAMQRSAGK